MTRRVFESETKKCARCGHQIKSFEYKCPNCGAPAPKEEKKVKFEI